MISHFSSLALILHWVLPIQSPDPGKKLMELRIKLMQLHIETEISITNS